MDSSTSQTTAPLMAAVDSPSSSLDNMLLNDESGNISYKNTASLVTLSKHSLLLRNVKKSNKLLGEFLLSTIVGASCKSKKYSKETIYFAEIYVYVVSKGCCSGPNRRRIVVVLDFGKSASSCQKWTNAINSVIAGYIPLLIADNGVDVLPPPKQKHFLIFVNPVSGKGLGVKIWTKQVQPILQDANVKVNLITTQRANHAKEFLLDHDLSGYDAVLVVGGDGLLFEVINGIGARGDADAIFNTLPVCPIPGGTANGLVKSILFECNEVYSPLNATFVTLKGTPQPLDLSRVVTKSGHSHLSFLILGWGLISDIDILSESMRYLGEPRLYVAAAYFMMKKRKYKGRLRMQLASSSSSSNIDIGSNNNNLRSTEPYQLQSNSSGADLEAQASAAVLDSTNWVTVEGEFILVWVVQTSHASASMYSGPGASLADGLFTIYVVKDMSRFELLQMLIGADTGEHVKHPKVTTYKATAYSLEPLTDKGLYTLDGEVIEYGMLQATMLPSYAKVLSLNT